MKERKKDKKELLFQEFELDPNALVAISAKSRQNSRDFSLDKNYRSQSRSISNRS